jgi:hypothetical protein
MGNDLHPTQFVDQQLQRPLLTARRRLAATQRHQPRFRRTVEDLALAGIGPGLPGQRRLQSRRDELLPNPFHLLLRQPHDLGNLPVRPTALRMIRIRQQQNPRPPHGPR